MESIFNKNELKDLQDIQNTGYMKPIIAQLDNALKRLKDKTKAFNEIYQIILNARSDVEIFLDERIRNGEISDKAQSLKSIAGNAFSLSIIYIFLKNKEIGNIREDIYITSKTNRVPNFKEISVINVGDETQKPDCDIVIYSLDNDKTLKKCIILSLKTSLRERAGQTYKWKLLLEIATTDNNIKDKYNITYNPKVIPLVCFATINFYNEINNPQQRGMFKFFDKAFIGKNLDQKGSFIEYLSDLPNYVNEVL